MESKKASQLTITKIITIALIVLVVLLVIFLIFRVDLLRKIDNYFPNFLPDPVPKDYEYAKECPIPVARLKASGNYRDIYICQDSKCAQQSKISLYLDSEDNVWVYQGETFGTDEQVGKVVRSTFTLYPEVLFGKSSKERPDLYEEVKDNIPSQADLSALDLAYFFSADELCKSSVTNTPETEVQREATTRTIIIKQKLFYFNVNEFLQKKGSANTLLYLDTLLTKKANSYIDAQGKIHREAEEGESLEPQLLAQDIIPPSPQHISNYQMRELNEKEMVEFTLKESLDNSNNYLGVDSGSDPFTIVKFYKVNGKVYVQFLEKSWSNSETPWILLDYWNAYRSFQNLPAWAKL